VNAKTNTKKPEKEIFQMNDAERDFLMWKNQKGRYAPAGKWADATRPMEGGTAAAGYVPKAGKVTSRPQAMYRSHNGAVVSSVEPEALGTDAIQFSPPQMQADPFDKKAGALETEMPEPIIQDAEAQDAYTPIACFVEGEPAPVR